MRAQRGEYYWLWLFGAPNPVPAKLGLCGWYVIGESAVVNEFAIKSIGARIEETHAVFRNYGEWKMEQERDY